MAARLQSRDLTVGVMFALGLAILAIGIMTVGGESRLFADKFYYRVNFPAVEGLGVGSPVKMAGVQVGTVSDIRLPKNPASPGIIVEIGVDKDYAARVREDSEAALRLLQLLTGEKYVEITPGSATMQQLPEGAELRLLKETELLEQASATAENLTQITVSLQKILDDVVRGEGLLGQLITDPGFGRGPYGDLEQSFTNIRKVTESLIEGKGTVGRLLYDEELAGSLDGLATAVESATATLAQLDLDKGAVGELLREDGRGKQIVEDLAVASTSLRRSAQALESGDGLLPRLIHDGELAASVAGDLESLLGDLASIVGKIDRGEGTIGALVNERELHDSFEDLATGANDSKFTRWLLRRYRKKGIEIEGDSADPDPG